jgi:hypothetical protein
MKLFDSLGMITLFSAALAIPQQNHNDSAEKPSIYSGFSNTNVESTSNSNEAASTPADSTSFSGNIISTFDNSPSSSVSRESKPEDRFLGFDIPRGLFNANVDVSNIGRVQTGILGLDGVSNVKADVLGVGVGANLEGNGYPYPLYYPPYPPQSNISTGKINPPQLFPNTIPYIPPYIIVFGYPIYPLSSPPLSY